METRLTKIVLQNFQRFVDQTIEVDPLVTCLTGNSDSGKSSAVRGAGFALLNKPSSPKLARRKQTKPAVVETHFGKTVVKRTRGKKQNDYHLNGKVYKAFGRDKVPLPPDVQKLVNMAAVNVQGQWSGPSWFTDTPGNRSKRLNTIVDLAVVDNALHESAKLVRESAAKVKFTRDRLRESKELAAKLDWVPGAVAEWEAVSKAESEYAAIRSRNAQVAKLLGEATSCRSIRDRASEAILEGKKALSAGSRYLKVRKRQRTIATLVQQLEEIQRVTAFPLPDISDLVELRAECDAVAERRREVEYLVEELLDVRKQRWKVEQKLDEARRRERKLRPETCKACGQPIKKQS